MNKPEYLYGLGYLMGRETSPDFYPLGQVAQQVEQGFCKPQVVGSIPSLTSKLGTGGGEANPNRL